MGLLTDEASIDPLTEALLLDEDEAVRTCAARSLAARNPSVTMVDALLRCGEERHLGPGDLDRTLLALAMGPALEHGFPDGTSPIDRLIGSAVDRAQPWPYLAALILALSGDSQRAGEALNAFERKNSVPPDGLRWLRIELGGSTALDPILDRLRSDLHEYFQVPVHALNEETRSHWKQTLADARWGFRVRMAMSVVVFVVGVLLLTVSSWQFLFGSLDATQAWGAGVSFVGGLGAMLLVIYSDPFGTSGRPSGTWVGATRSSSRTCTACSRPATPSRRCTCGSA